MVMLIFSTRRTFVTRSPLHRWDGHINILAPEGPVQDGGLVINHCPIEVNGASDRHLGVTLLRICTTASAARLFHLPVQYYSPL
jgi:hypothetical protein